LSYAEDTVDYRWSGFGGIHADIGAKSRFLLDRNNRLSFKGFPKFQEIFKRDLNVADKWVQLLLVFI
jgi:hypothetical protein